jgi:putative SOS response-associated peptidase YedK
MAFMCGRFTRTTPVRVLANLFDFVEAPDLTPRYNIAPTQSVAAVRQAGEQPKRELALLRWGLVPSWADDPKIGNSLINARAETAPSKPAFRAAFKGRRCLVLADGFYEWQKQGKHKQPYLICRRDRQPFAFAGLWERWHGGEEDAIESCAILTTSANDAVRAIHERMPVIVTPADYARWLDPKTPRAELEALLVPCRADELASFPVGKWVNDPKHDDAHCLDPA